MKCMSFDTETSISKGPHGPAAKELSNDFYTVIYGMHPNKIQVRHNEKGYKRTLPTDCVDMLNNSDYICGVNLKFDLLYIWRDEAFRSFIRRRGHIWDCQLAKYLLGGQRHTFPSLAEMQEYYLGQKTKSSKISLLFKKGIGADEIIKARNRCPRIWNLYNYYAKEDGRTPLLIMQKQYKEAKQKGMLAAIELFNEYLLVLCMMEHNGIPVNIPQAERTRKEFTEKMLGFQEKAQNIAAKYWNDERLPPLNIGSRHHASAVLFGGKIKCKETVKTGVIYKTGKRVGEEKTKQQEVFASIAGMQLNPVAYSNETKHEGVYEVNDGVIVKIKRDCKQQDAIDYCLYLTESSVYKKMISTYINAFINLSVDGRVSCDYNNTKTITSRLSSSRPNLQNIPAKNEELKNKVQGLLSAPEGWMAVAIDYSQLEVVVTGALSQDALLLQHIRDGVDFHVKRLAYAENMFYKDVYQKCIIEKDKEWVGKRKSAKTISFQKAYGASPEKLAEETGLSIETIKTIFEREDAEYCGVAEWEKNDVQKQVYSNIELCTKQQLSYRDAKLTKNGRRFVGDNELLPIRQLDKVTYAYNKWELRHVGFYQSPTGKRYAFEEKGAMTKRADVFKYYPPTQLKNYQVQGTASDVQAASSAEMFHFLLDNQDKVLLVNEVHDSKWFLVKKEYIHLTIPKLCNIMTNIREIFKRRFNWDTNIDFRAEVECGENFAEIYPYKSKGE